MTAATFRAFALALVLLPASAGAQSNRAIDFGPPTLDGVAPGLRTNTATPDLRSYSFAGGRDWPAIRLQARHPLDWRGAGGLALPVDNPSAAPFALLLRLDDRPDANGDDRSLTGLITVPPHARVTVLLPLSGGGPLGMRGRPPTGLLPGPDDLLMTDVRGTVDLGHVTALHVSGIRTETDHPMRIGAPALRAAPAAARNGPLADAFGQAVAGRWPEKVDTVEALRQRLASVAAETRGQARHPSPLAPDGGAATVAREATGAFRAAKVGGRWALVTPAGRPFFSLGVDSVTPANTTVVGGREGLFTGLPDAGSPLARFYGQDNGRRTFDVGAANLYRGLGPDWRRLWSGATVARLKAWGFNTLGNWSEADLGPALPHVVFYDVEGDSAMIPMGGRSLPDPFDPRFPAVADAVATAMTAGHASDPTLIGYFSGNELPWGETDKPADSLPAHVLALPPDSFARRAFVAALRQRYAGPGALAAAWGLPALKDWDDPIGWPPRETSAARADRDRLEALFAERYFATVAAAIHRHDPAHLYLGTRFASWTPAIVRACARFCDVLSFNVYGPTPATAAAAWRDLDKPVLIGEFHFGSTDRGSFWPGMVAVPSEANRGPAYAAYLQAALADPAIVGVHWYQYADEPLTGRPYDGENGHIGLVAVTDVPFAGFVAAVTEANRSAMEDFARQVTPADR